MKTLPFQSTLALPVASLQDSPRRAIVELFLVGLGIIANMLNPHILTVFILATCLVPNLPADDHPRRITPTEWRPDVSAAIEWLEQDLQETKAQQGFNRLSRRIADLKDAQLFAVYIRLYQHLGVDARQKLCREQAKWLLARTKYAEDHIESHGGSLAPWEANKAEIEFTEKRLVDLNKRLSAYEHN